MDYNILTEKTRWLMCLSELQKCLDELGFPKEEIEKFISGDHKTRLQILTDFRQDKVSAMHGVYKDLECIDYLIAELEKN